MKKETKKLVYGVGTNDADYVVHKYEMIDLDGKKKRKLVWYCPYYRAWISMMQRCYSTNEHKRHPTYINCTVSDEWHVFSNFKKWMMTQDYEGKQLDKDLLLVGNKVYSAETCVFVTSMVNTFVNDHGAKRGKWLIGVNWHKRNKKFRAQCRNTLTKKKEYLGLFTTEIEAHQAWAKRKLELAHELAAIQSDPRIAEALIKRYS